jgi:hypothetical protein
LFNDKESVQSYVKFFKLDEKIEWWGELKDADISSSSETK